MTFKEKFQKYFNLKEGFYIQDDQIDGECEHEGQHVEFQLYIYDIDSIYDFDEGQVNRYKEIFTRDKDGANYWIEDCIVRGIGFDLSIDYDGEYDFEWDIYDYILNEGIYEYIIPSICEPETVLIENL